MAQTQTRVRGGSGLAYRLGLGPGQWRLKSRLVDITEDDVEKVLCKVTAARDMADDLCKAEPTRGRQNSGSTEDLSISDSFSSASDDEWLLEGSVGKRSVRFSKADHEYFDSNRVYEEIVESWCMSDDEILESRQCLQNCVAALQDSEEDGNWYCGHSENREPHMRRGIEHLIDPTLHEQKLRQGRCIRQAVLKACKEKGYEKAAKVYLQLSAADVKEAQEKARIDVLTAINIYAAVFADSDKFNVQSSLQALKESISKKPTSTMKRISSTVSLKLKRVGSGASLFTLWDKDR